MKTVDETFVQTFKISILFVVENAFEKDPVFDRVPGASSLTHGRSRATSSRCYNARYGLRLFDSHFVPQLRWFRTRTPHHNFYSHGRRNSLAPRSCVLGCERVRTGRPKCTHE